MALPRDNRFQGITTIVQNGAAVPQYHDTFCTAPRTLCLSALRNNGQVPLGIQIFSTGNSYTTYSSAGYSYKLVSISIRVDMTNCRISYLNKQAHKLDQRISIQLTNIKTVTCYINWPSQFACLDKSHSISFEYFLTLPLVSHAYLGHSYILFRGLKSNGLG